LKIYFISGMGADRRLFKNIRLPEHFEAEYLEWISFQKNESLGDYAGRLSEGIDASEPFILAGISLGGMMAVEIAKKVPPVCTIMISSIPVSAQLPFYFKIGRWLPLVDLVPTSFFKSAAILKRLITNETSADKELVRQMIRESDPGFIRWAMKAVVKWDNKWKPEPFWHIHGTRDEIFPIWKVRPTHIIQKGDHLLIMTRFGEVNSILEQLLLPYKG
jgi:pimeloyl-ACP methyl ester carboxylesterase